MKLIRAIYDDFSTFKSMYDNIDLSVLYSSSCDEDEAEAQEFTCWWFDEEDFAYTEDEFIRDITCPGSYIFFVKEKEEILGYIKIFRIQGSRYKLADWGLFDNTPKMRKSVWKLFLGLKKPRIKEVEICISEKSQSAKWMENLGFKACGHGFYRFEAGTGN